MLTKQERRSAGIAKRLTRALADMERYDGDPSDVLDDAVVFANKLPEVKNLIEALRQYYTSDVADDKAEADERDAKAQIGGR